MQIKSIILKIQNKFTIKSGEEPVLLTNYIIIIIKYQKYNDFARFIINFDFNIYIFSRNSNFSFYDERT